MNKFRHVVFGVGLMLGAHIGTRAQEKATVSSNVALALLGEGLSEHVRFAWADNNHAFYFPVQNADGTFDQTLEEHMKGKAATHDWSIASRLMGNGAYSRRLKRNFSLQVACFYNNGYPGGVLYMMDVDISPPSWGAPIKSGKHLFREHLRQDLFGKEKDQNRIAAGLEKRYRISSNRATATADK
ncbi:MAG TPA: hypothetical protein VLL54_13110 [Pyrinomonadaceae bacterium]|nr:hypothetical protein [Pyrinomonadaceae bacterium]